MTHSHYEVLGLTESASPDEVTAAYRALAKVYHPDLQGGNTERFKKINEAHGVLKDSYKRSLHNYELKLRKVYANQHASQFEKVINVVVSGSLFIFGIYLWGLGDKKGNDYNGWFVLFGWASVLYGVGLFSRKEFKFSNPITIVRVVLNYIFLMVIGLVMRMTIIGAVILVLVILLGAVSWLNSHLFHILPDSF